MRPVFEAGPCSPSRRAPLPELGASRASGNGRLMQITQGERDVFSILADGPHACAGASRSGSSRQAATAGRASRPRYAATGATGPSRRTTGARAAFARIAGHPPSCLPAPCHDSGALLLREAARPPDTDHEWGCQRRVGRCRRLQSRRSAMQREFAGPLGRAELLLSSLSVTSNELRRI